MKIPEALLASNISESQALLMSLGLCSTISWFRFPSRVSLFSGTSPPNPPHQMATSLHCSPVLSQHKVFIFP